MNIKVCETNALVSAEWYREHQDDPDLVLVEISGMGSADVSAYDEGHIPGALNWQWQAMLWDPVKRDFPTSEDFAERMASQGIGDNTTVILYGEDIQFGSYAWWVLRFCGHDRVRLLDGGRKAWLARGFALEQVGNSPHTVARYTPRQRRQDMRILREDVLAHINSDGLIIDARSPEEFEGKRLMPFGYDDHGAVRYGRIPGARHLYYLDIADETKSFRSATELRALFGNTAGDDDQIVVYCRLSHRASFLYFGLTQLLGFKNVKLYDGSWTEWGSLVGYPIENESGQ
ncbi:MULTISPECIES: sulfurtransferase [Rhizobium/Agrobacterium group]|uniref:Sulfurtransferase n=1 Tax=Agrobacterium tumefaciens str. Kerr 14 TaxID=1183424 RepID=A0A1S7SDT1_AGRTU|nr:MULTISPECIES: sulfurtransferase [Rhizobium/Agrobacterium group]NTF97801.1 sulfurtransferase [Rhizobium rhizogenes]CUX67052.1 putative thiosulfate sulfurtransferase [Agrobacterium tumefaciens str. Kerr 14]